MITATVTKADLEAGVTCRACKTLIPPTPHYAVRCPKCSQLHQASAPAPERP